MSAPDLIAPLYSSGGTIIGMKVSGYLGISSGVAQGGFIMQDSTGAYWLLTIGTDGRLDTVPVTL